MWNKRQVRFCHCDFLLRYHVSLSIQLVQCHNFIHVSGLLMSLPSSSRMYQPFLGMIRTSLKHLGPRFFPGLQPLAMRVMLSAKVPCLTMIYIFIFFNPAYPLVLCCHSIESPKLNLYGLLMQKAFQREWWADLWGWKVGLAHDRSDFEHSLSLSVSFSHSLSLLFTPFRECQR